MVNQYFSFSNGDTTDVDEVESEGFRFLMLQVCQNSMKEVLNMLVADKTISRLYPQLRKLVAVALVHPMSTAKCERAF